MFHDEVSYKIVGNPVESSMGQSHSSGSIAAPAPEIPSIPALFTCPPGWRVVTIPRAVNGKPAAYCRLLPWMLAPTTTRTATPTHTLTPEQWCTGDQELHFEFDFGEKVPLCYSGHSPRILPAGEFCNAHERQQVVTYQSSDKSKNFQGEAVLCFNEEKETLNTPIVTNVGKICGNLEFQTLDVFGYKVVVCSNQAEPPRVIKSDQSCEKDEFVSRIDYGPREANIAKLCWSSPPPEVHALFVP